MSKCRVCGNYVDRYEWPQDHLDQFRHNLCFTCFLKEKEEQEQEEDEIESFDPNTEFGLSEVHPDPEDDDAPDLGASDNNELEENNDESCNETGSEMSISPEEESIRNMRRLLFG